MKKLLLAIWGGVFLFNSCGKDNNPTINNTTLSERFKGKWILEKINGIPAMTDEKFIMTFDTFAYISTSKNDYSNELKKWSYHRKFDVESFADSMILSAQVNDNPEIQVVQTVKNIQFISNEEILATVVEITYQNGNIIKNVTSDKLIKRIDESDYKQTLLGSWQGHKTSDESVYDDDKEHIWQYNANQTFVYKTDSAGTWITSETDFSEYFVDGPLLCTRWKNKGETEKREWWEIVINNDTMTWYGLRKHKNEDGNTFTATFRMTKVK